MEQTSHGANDPQEGPGAGRHARADCGGFAHFSLQPTPLLRLIVSWLRERIRADQLASRMINEPGFAVGTGAVENT